MTNSYDNTVTGVDLATLSALAPIAVGTQPSGISYSTQPPAKGASAVSTLDIPTPSSPGPRCTADTTERSARCWGLSRRDGVRARQARRLNPREARPIRQIPVPYSLARLLGPAQ